MKQGLYVYAVVPGADPHSFGAIGLEHSGSPAEVRLLVHEGVAALVSPHAIGSRVPPTRGRLEAHYRALREAGQQLTVIPVAFGHVATETAVVRLLRRNRKQILSELDALEGRVQMSVRIDWDADSIFDYFVSSYPDLAELRDEVFGHAAPPSQMAKIELGRLFEEHRDEERARFGALLLTAFEPLDAVGKLAPVRGEKRVAEALFLIRKEQAAAFEAIVYSVAARWPAGFTFDFSGPFVPFDFVSLQLELERKAS